MYSSEEVLTSHWSQATEFPNNRQYHAYKYFSPRWRKTQVTFFASCVNSDKIFTEEPPHERGNTILAPPPPLLITTNGSQNSGNHCSDFELSSKPAGITSSQPDVSDDVFLSPLHRRASEPVKQDGGTRFGRSKTKLNRSLSAGVVKEKPQEHRKLSKSKSSEPHCRGVGIGNAIPQLFSFSPQFVRKTSLRASLHDWLGSHKIHMQHPKNFRKTKKSANGDSGVRALEGDEKQFEKSADTLSPDSLETWKPDCRNDTDSAKHVYRRFSADSLAVSPALQKPCCIRRPSAPPSLSRDPPRDDEHEPTCYQRKSVQVKTMTTPQNIRHAAIVTCCNTDTKYANLLDFHLHCVMREELRSRLGGLCFRPESCRDWCEEISEDIKTRVQLLSSSPCKVICTVYIGALRDFGLHSASQALLDYKLDHHASACYQNKSLFAVASVFAVRYSCK